MFGSSTGIRATNRERFLAILRRLDLKTEPDIEILAQNVIGLVEKAEVYTGAGDFYNIIYSEEIAIAFRDLKIDIENRALYYGVERD